MRWRQLGCTSRHVLLSTERYAAAPAVAALNVDARGVEAAHFCRQALAAARLASTRAP